MTIKPRTLAQMQNTVTAYEVAVTYKGTETRLAFTQRRTKAVLFAVAQQNGPMLLEMLDTADLDCDWTYSKATGVCFGSARVHFTGRTERDCTAS